MTNEFEPNAIQKAPGLIQDLSKIPAIAWIAFGLLWFTVAGILAWYWCGMLLIGAWAVISNIERKHALELARARASSYVNHIGPVVISATRPDETLEELQERADIWRQKLRESGNPYTDIIPIIINEYRPVLTEYGALSMSWTIYDAHVGQRKYEENMKWYDQKCPKDLKARFAADVLPAPKVEYQNAN